MCVCVSVLYVCGCVQVCGCVCRCRCLCVRCVRFPNKQTKITRTARIWSEGPFPETGPRIAGLGIVKFADSLTGSTEVCGVVSRSLGLSARSYLPGD